ncbi:RNA polymerase-binding protein RbpA [Saccharopolyspora endophytica]|uniref:RNA polymerase-binding protein RbpA n=1 Tax=Saccharopolyspora endophytica TaxID=543886 RepID=A0ABS5DQM8_9PSEU|nr:RNA polymerase-binding protein RbpA [Saccharopolyspora endophytica]MBQ0928599.1 RNA polymerase-binding protein RbpA [Saccharopolyspora endophytica]
MDDSTVTTADNSKHWSEPVAHQIVRYSCPMGHVLELHFADTAQPPLTWTCPHHSQPADLTGNSGGNAAEPSSSARRDKTHLDHVLQRRTFEDLAALLDEQLRKRHR